MQDYRFKNYYNDEDLEGFLKPINEVVEKTMTANEFYKFDTIKDENEMTISGVTKPEDINIEDMDIDDKIDLSKKLITNIFDNKKDNDPTFLNTMIELMKLSKDYIYKIDPEWVDEDEQTAIEEQPPEFEEALQNLNEPEQPEEEIAPEETGEGDEAAPEESEEDLINNAFA